MAGVAAGFGEPFGCFSDRPVVQVGGLGKDAQYAV